MKIFLTFFALTAARYLENGGQSSMKTRAGDPMMIRIDSDLGEKSIFYESRQVDLQNIFGKQEKEEKFGPQVQEP